MNQEVGGEGGVMIDTPAKNGGGRRRIRMSLVRNAKIETPSKLIEGRGKCERRSSVKPRNEMVEEEGGDVEMRQVEEEAQEDDGDMIIMEELDDDDEEEEIIKAEGLVEEEPQQQQELLVSTPSPSPSKSIDSPSKSKSKSASASKKARRSSGFFGRAGVKSAGGEIKKINGDFYGEEINGSNSNSSSSPSSSPTKVLGENNFNDTSSPSKQKKSLNPFGSSSDDDFKIPRLPSKNQTPPVSPSKNQFLPTPTRPLQHSPSKNRRVSLRTDFLVRRTEEFQEEREREMEERKRLEEEMNRKDKEEWEERQRAREMKIVDEDQDEKLMEGMDIDIDIDEDKEDEDEIEKSLSFSLGEDDENGMDLDNSSPLGSSPLSPPNSSPVQHQSFTASLGAFLTPQPQKLKIIKGGRKSTGRIKKISLGGRKSSGDDWITSFGKGGMTRTKSAPDGLLASPQNNGNGSILGQDEEEIHGDGETSRALDALCEEAEGHETDEEEIEQDVQDQAQLTESPEESDSFSIPPPPSPSTSTILPISTPGPASRSSISVKASSSLKKAGRRSSTSFYASKESSSPDRNSKSGMLKDDALAALKHVLYSSAVGNENKVEEQPQVEETRSKVEEVEEAPKYGGLREMMRNVPGSQELLSLANSPKKKGHSKGSKSPATPDMRDLKHFLKEPVNQSTPSMEGLRDSLNLTSSPAMQVDVNVRQLQVPSTPIIESHSKPRKSVREQQFETPDLSFLKHVFALPPKVVEADSNLKNVRDLFEAHREELTSLTPVKERQDDLKKLLDTSGAKRVIIKAATGALNAETVKESPMPSPSLSPMPSPYPSQAENSGFKTPEIPKALISSSPIKPSVEQENSPLPKLKTSEGKGRVSLKPRKSLGESLAGRLGRTSLNPPPSPPVEVSDKDKVMKKKTSRNALDSSSSSPFKNTPSKPRKSSKVKSNESTPRSELKVVEHEPAQKESSSSPSKKASRRKSSRNSLVGGKDSELPVSQSKDVQGQVEPEIVVEEVKEAEVERQVQDQDSVSEAPTEAEIEAEKKSKPSRRPKREAALMATSSIAALSSSPAPFATSSSRSKKSQPEVIIFIPSKGNGKMSVEEDEEAQQEALDEPSSPTPKARTSRKAAKATSSSPSKRSQVKSSSSRSRKAKVEVEEVEDAQAEEELGEEVEPKKVASKGRSRSKSAKKDQEVEEEENSSDLENEAQAVEEEATASRKGRATRSKSSTIKKRTATKKQLEENEDQETEIEPSSEVAESTTSTRSKRSLKSSKSNPSLSSSVSSRGTTSRSKKVEEKAEEEQNEEEEVPVVKTKASSTRTRAKTTKSSAAEEDVDLDAPVATRATRSRAAKR